mmetsp:Transcript_47404/g.109717  ORF Transcript_47404/g.109717 Transcript_47404/m.109717 type:complete len:236 (+) Transcript_47404:45-752(+)
MGTGAHIHFRARTRTFKTGQAASARPKKGAAIEAGLAPAATGTVASAVGAGEAGEAGEAPVATAAAVDAAGTGRTELTGLAPSATERADTAREWTEEVTEYGGIQLHGDGYPNGYMVHFVKELLVKCKIDNGITCDMAMGTHANGPGCLFAQLVALAKTRIGGTYMLAIEKPGQKRYRPDYSYVVEVLEGFQDVPSQIRIHVSSPFRGAVDDDTDDEAPGRARLFTPEEYLARWG